MAHYTPLDQTDIFPSEFTEHKLITYAGKSIYVQETEAGQLQLIRLVSTDPEDYLNPVFTPGTKLTYESLIEMK